MHTIIRTKNANGRDRSASPASAEFRKPVYDCQDQCDALKLVVYVPGVDSSGVCIEAQGPDLVVTARKQRFVRVNWQSLHLEGSQRDYRLSLRLGRGIAYEAMQAEIANGVLTVILPKRRGDPAGAAAHLRRVA